MGDLVKDRPKPLIKVSGKPLIDHALDLTKVPGVGQRVVNLHHHGEMLRDHLADQDILFSDESDALLETGGGLRKALPLLNASPVLTMNTDAIWKGPNPVKTILDAWQDHMEALLLLVPKSHISGHHGHGDFEIDKAGRLTRAPDAVYPGLQMIRTEGLKNISQTKFSLNVLWDEIASRGGLYGTIYHGQWCDVGNVSSIPIAEAMLDV